MSMTHPEQCSHCSAELVETDTHYASDGDKVCGACQKADLAETLDGQGVGLASRSLYIVTGVLAIVVGVALIGWGLYKIFGDVSSGRRTGATLIGGAAAIGLGIQQLRRKY